MSRIDAADSVVRARESFRLQGWGSGFNDLSRADADATLHPDDLERLAERAQLLGRYAEGDVLLSRLHHASLAEGDSPRAARAQRVIDEAGSDCVERAVCSCRPADPREQTGTGRDQCDLGREKQEPRRS